MGKYKIHKDYKYLAKVKIPLYPYLLPFINYYTVYKFKRKKVLKGTMEKDISIPGYQGCKIRLTVISPIGVHDTLPCIVYLHGGAFAFEAKDYHKEVMCEYALKAPCKIIFVHYHLTPKYSFPIAIEECYAAYLWTYRNANRLGIDKNRLAIAGDSAGGTLAAALTHMIRDRKGPSCCYQMLIYPATDARENSESMRRFTDTPLWNSKLNHKMWRYYLKNGVYHMRKYASPIESNSFKKLPPAYIEVAEFDCLKDEGKEYAKKLKDAGIPVCLIETKGTIHGFEIRMNSDYTKSIIEKRIKHLKKYLS